MPTTDHPLVGRPATELADAVRRGETTAVAVAEAHLDQLAAVEHRLGAYVRVLRREALAAAAEVDAHPERASLPLAGVPVAIKDVAAVAGWPTRHGSRGTSTREATADEDVVARWRAAGAVPLGITRCPELSLWGSSDDPEGTAVSPWDPSRTAGGSSGGSAAAVAAGTVAVGLASDGLGSVRIPAAACGLVGIKPGADLAPVTLPDGSRHWFGMSRFGPVATTVADAALALSVLADRPELASVVAPTRRLKVAVSVAPPAPGVIVTAAWREAALEAGRLLRHAGHDVRRADPPYEPATIGAAMLRWFQGAARDVDELVEAPDQLQPRTRTHAAIGRALASRIPVAPSQAQRWRDRVTPFLDDVDVLITPMFAREPLSSRAWHRTGWAGNVVANLTTYPFAAAWNLADVPAGTVPVGSERGKPTAVQIVSRAGGEATILSVAAQIESLAGWRRHAPGWGVPA